MTTTFKLSAGDDALLESLEIHAASKERRELTLSFDRSREVEISWNELITTSTAPTKKHYMVSDDAVEPLYYFFAREWGVADPLAPTQPEVNSIRTFKVRQISDRMVVLAMGPLGSSTSREQLYNVVARQNVKFSATDFDSPAAFLAFWTKVDRFSIDFDTMSQMEELDLSPALIWRQFRELRNLRSISEVFAKKADDFAQSTVTSLLQPEQLGTIVSQYMNMKQMGVDVEERLLRLKDAAEDLGYVLNVRTSPVEFSFPNGEKDVIQPGELYQPYKKWISWLTKHTRRHVNISSSWFGSSIHVHDVVWYTQNWQNVTSYRHKVVDFDPWVEKERELAQDGLRSFRFDRVGGVFVTQDGATLEEVLDLCDRDQSFWSECAIWIPVYEQKLTQGQALTRYLIIKRPLRGSQVMHLPQVFVQERLALRRDARVRTEVGELAHTINLAPGEKRTITVERSSTSEREDRRSAKSLVDLVDTTSTDFATEFEKEARHETEQTSSSNWSVSASGSYAGFSAGGSGGGSSTEKVSDFARRLEKMAQKAARNVTKKTQEEINTSSSVKTTTSSTDRNVIEIENVNPGASLNLAFYRLNNVSKLGLYLEGLEFVVLSGIETVASAGIVLPETFRLDQLQPMIKRLSLAAMPVKPVGDAKAARRAHARQLLLDLIRTLGDYELVSSGEDLPTIRKDVEAYDPAADTDDLELTALIERLQRFLTEAALGQTPLAGKTQEVVSGSAGFYLDTFVGVRPATEDYAVRAREAELDMRAAEVAEIRARAAAQRSLAQPALPPVNVVTATAIDAKTVDLVFRDAPTKGVWRLYVDGADANKTLTADGKTKAFKLTFTDEQYWLRAGQANIAQLLHEPTQAVLSFLI